MFSHRLDFAAPENRLAELERNWQRGETRPLDLTISNPTVVGLGELGPALAAALARPEVAHYQPEPLGPASARAQVAGELARLGANLAAGRIVLTASSSESYSLLWKLLCDPGDVVLVPAPSYPLFEHLAALEGVKVRLYRLAHTFGSDWHIDWSSFEPAGARAVVVVNPNNPTGSFLLRADHQRLVQTCADRDIPLVVDEVFADYAFTAPAEAVRTVTAEPAPRALTFTLGGLSKSAGLPQMKLGWMALLGPEHLVQPARARLELIADTYLSVNTPVLAALPALLALGARRRAEIGARVQDNRRRLAALVGTAGAVRLLPGDGGWSAILRLPATRGDEDWALALLEQDGVLVQPGYFFDLEGLGAALVLSLLVPPADLEEGVRRLLARVALSS
jgi:aspartate/methionine/tyrosine aminotransferase